MQIEDKTIRSPDNGLLKPLIDLKVVPVPLILIHEISAAVERNKKWGSKNKIGHSIFLRLPPPLSPTPQEAIKSGLCPFLRRRQHFEPFGSVGCNLQWCRQQNYIG